MPTFSTEPARKNNPFATKPQAAAPKSPTAASHPPVSPLAGLGATGKVNSQSAAEVVADMYGGPKARGDAAGRMTSLRTDLARRSASSGIPGQLDATLPGGGSSGDSLIAQALESTEEPINPACVDQVMNGRTMLPALMGLSIPLANMITLLAPGPETGHPIAERIVDGVGRAAQDDIMEEVPNPVEAGVCGMLQAVENEAEMEAEMPYIPLDPEACTSGDFHNIQHRAAELYQMYCE